MKKYITYITTILITSGMVATTNTIAAELPIGSGWQPTYTVGPEGNNMGGRLEALVQAIDNGADVKVKFFTKSSDIEVTIPCQWVGVKRGNSLTKDAVACINTSLVSFEGIVDGMNTFGFKNTPVPIYTMLNTNGDLDSRRSDLPEETRSTGKYEEAEWYTKTN